MRYRLERIRFMPKALAPGVLYVSDEFSTSAHLCACGCGEKVRTPLGPTEWSVEEGPHGPCLRPSVGNWQKSCRSHYWIWDGAVIWSEQWTPEQVVAGRLQEEERRRTHYEAVQPVGFIGRLWQWLSRLLGSEPK